MWPHATVMAADFLYTSRIFFATLWGFLIIQPSVSKTFLDGFYGAGTQHVFGIIGIAKTTHASASSAAAAGLRPGQHPLASPYSFEEFLVDNDQTHPLHLYAPRSRATTSNLFTPSGDVAMYRVGPVE